MAWRNKVVMPRKRIHRSKTKPSLWHPCGHCADYRCGKKGEVSKLSLSAFASSQQIEDCPDRIKPYWERLND
jgi:hypothetical protein